MSEEYVQVRNEVRKIMVSYMFSRPILSAVYSFVAGLHFVVDSDIKRWSSLKMDTAGKSLLTLLRTLKRLREVRGPASLVRYAALPSSMLMSLCERGRLRNL